MGLQRGEAHIGFSVFDASEECWEYNENACLIASTADSAEVVLQNSWADPRDCRVEVVCFADIMRDYGVSGGEYAMELDAFRRFQEVAALNSVSFESEPYDGDDTLIVVNVDHRALLDAERE